MTALEYIKVFESKVDKDDKKSSKHWMAEFAEQYHQYRKNRYWIIRFLKL